MGAKGRGITAHEHALAIAIRQGSEVQLEGGIDGVADTRDQVAERLGIVGTDVISPSMIFHLQRSGQGLGTLTDIKVWEALFA